MENAIAFGQAGRQAGRQVWAWQQEEYVLEPAYRRSAGCRVRDRSSACVIINGINTFNYGHKGDSARRHEMCAKWAHKKLWGEGAWQNTICK